MDKLQLQGIKDKLVKSCSGGMKRKLSLAIALLGDPPVILLVMFFAYSCILMPFYYGWVIIKN